MYKKICFLILMGLLFFGGCDKTAGDDHFGEVGLQIRNQLPVTIDTFNFHFDTSAGEDSLLITELLSGGESSIHYYDDITYRFVEKDDIFLIKKGRFVIEEKSYYVANCFCDPGIQTGEFSDGSMSIQIEGIDSLRGNVVYTIRHN